MSIRAFAPDDPAWWPVFAACQEHGLLALFRAASTSAPWPARRAWLSAT